MDEGDAAAHAFIAAELVSARPDDALLSEEVPTIRAGTHHDRVWIVDPLDGTASTAIHGEATGRCTSPCGTRGADRGGGGAAGDGAPRSPPIPRRSCPIRRRRSVVVTSRSRPSFVTAIAAEAIGADVVSLGSAGAKAMAVVTGIADVYVHAGGMYQWDSAAPAAVAMAAGLHVSRIDGSPIVYNEPAPWLPDFLVCREEYAAPCCGDRQGLAEAIAVARSRCALRDVPTS